MNSIEMPPAPSRSPARHGLLKLQEALAAGSAEMIPTEAVDDTLLVRIGDKRFGFRDRDVAFISMAKESISILGYRYLPRCVVAVASSNERLYTVIDAANLFDLGTVTVDARARLIAFNHPSLDAVMLLVSEITGRSDSGSNTNEYTRLKPEALFEMLQAVGAPAAAR